VVCVLGACVFLVFLKNRKGITTMLRYNAYDFAGPAHNFKTIHVFLLSLEVVRSTIPSVT